MHKELLFLVQKVTISEKSTEILRNLFFLTCLKRGKFWGKFGFVWTTVFYPTRKRGQILTKTFFLLKMSHIQLNYTFLLFWSISGEIHCELLFLVKKLTISEGALKYSESSFFLTTSKRVISWGKFGFIITTDFEQTSKWGQILTKTVFLHKMSHIQLNYAFLSFWSYFILIHWKLLFLVQKWLFHKRAQKYSEIRFLIMFEKGKILRKFWISLNNSFWSHK